MGTEVGRYAGRKARERATRCAEVLVAARRLYAEKGYQATTMAEVARASELAIGTLYELFPSKEAILFRLLEEQIDRLLARLREAADTGTDARRQIEAVVQTHLGFARANADLLRLYLSGWIGYDPAVRRRVGGALDAKYEAYLELLADVLRRGIRAGLFARRPVRALAVGLAGMVHALIRRSLVEPDLDLLAEGEGLLELFLHGALARERGGRDPARAARRKAGA